ncbi:MAG: AAA family ATPase [Pseudomonadota bacterium]
MPFDKASRSNLRLARSAVPRGAQLDATTLVAALVHETDLRERLPGLAARLSPPRSVRSSVDEVPVEPELEALLSELTGREAAVSPRDLMRELLSRDASRRVLVGRGVPEAVLSSCLVELGGCAAGVAPSEEGLPPSEGAPPRAQSAWQTSGERRAVLAKLSCWGQVLTEGPPPVVPSMVHEQELRLLIRHLVKPKRRSCIVHGPAGCGKTTLVKELARRLMTGQLSLPPRVRDLDLFKLDPNSLRAGAKLAGQYEARVKELQELLAQHPQVLLFIDEIHTFFRSAMHFQGSQAEVNESFKDLLSAGKVCVIGCTTSVEYRHYIAPDPALGRRFEVVALPSPTPAQTGAILRAKLPDWSAKLGLRIPEELAMRAVELSEERIPSRLQPDKAQRLLEDACAFALTGADPAVSLTEAHLMQAVQDSQGATQYAPGDLDEGQILDRLKEKLLGQDEVLARIALAFLAGLGSWRRGGGPRGVFLFAGPTGVGKTQCAQELARILGGGQRPALVRVDCNTLQGSHHDASPALNRLLGVPPGYVGYVRGEGGILSRLRDQPTSVVLFDEIEKAPPGVGRLLLQILDEGRVEDSEGNLLDFRRAFIVFTSNAGCSYKARPRQVPGGFGLPDRRQLGRVEALADEGTVRAALLELGLGQEFLARIEHVFVFQAIEGEAARAVVLAQLGSLARRVAERGLRLTWSEGLADHMLAQWQVAFGVRHLTTILRNRVEEQLSLADARGELRGVTAIELRAIEPPPGLSPDLAAGMACLRRDDEDLSRLLILLG